jgi:hypothetical protein
MHDQPPHKKEMSSGEKMKGPAAAAAANLDPNNNKNTGIHTYEAAWPLYGMNWSNRRETRFRLAVGSFIEDYSNKVTYTHTTFFAYIPSFFSLSLSLTLKTKN